MNLNDVDGKHPAGSGAERQVTDFTVLNTMSRFGGSFASALATAAQYADATNLAKIKATWPELWTQYTDMALMLRGRDAEPRR